MSKLLNEDMHNILVRLPKDIRELMKRHDLMLGGGFIREAVAGNPPNDIDLLGPSVDRLKLAAAELYSSRGSKAKTLNTKNAITHVEKPRTTVQFITRWLFDNPTSLVESFDFTVCQAVIFWVPGEGRWDSVVADRFYPDLASKRLVYTSPHRNEDAGGSMLRMRKFLNRGYHISAENMGHILARVMQGVNESRVATSGEEGLAKCITSVLREVDPLLIVDGVEPVDVEHTEDTEDEHK